MSLQKPKKNNSSRRTVWWAKLMRQYLANREPFWLQRKVQVNGKTTVILSTSMTSVNILLVYDWWSHSVVSSLTENNILIWKIVVSIQKYHWAKYWTHVAPDMFTGVWMLDRNRHRKRNSVNVCEWADETCCSKHVVVECYIRTSPSTI